MATEASDYHRGEMDIAEQESTFVAFLKLSKWGSLAIAVGVLFFTILFCTKAGFFPAAIASVVVTVVGILLLSSKKTAH